MTAARVLVVEADSGRGAWLTKQLVADGFAATWASSASHARSLASGAEQSVIVIGGVDGAGGALALVKDLRAGGGAGGCHSWPATVVLATEARESDVLRAFDAGADDVMAGPLRYLELRARVRAILSRCRTPDVAPSRLLVGPLAVELDSRRVRLGGHAIELRRMEFELLAHLAADPERAYSRHQLLDSIWRWRSDVATRTVDTHAARLRRNLNARNHGRWIISVWGVGYRLR